MKKGLRIMTVIVIMGLSLALFAIPASASGNNMIPNGSDFTTTDGWNTTNPNVGKLLMGAGINFTLNGAGVTQYGFYSSGIVFQSNVKYHMDLELVMSNAWNNYKLSIYLVRNNDYSQIAHTIHTDTVFNPTGSRKFSLDFILPDNGNFNFLVYGVNMTPVGAGSNIRLLNVSISEPQYHNDEFGGAGGKFDDAADSLDEFNFDKPDFTIDVDDNVFILASKWFFSAGAVLTMIPGITTILTLSFLVWYVSTILGFTQRNMKNFSDYRNRDKGGKKKDDD